MKKIKYPVRGSVPFDNLINEYKAIFSAKLPQMEADWIAWKVKWNKYNLDAVITQTVEDLLIAETDVLADVFDKFVNLNIPKTQFDPLRNKNVKSDEYKELFKIFNYSSKTNGYDDAIAGFFMSHAKALHISICHYCELAYVNAYTIISSGGQNRQFDMDHFLPKSECPIVGLSLFNFVPSCQVCNSRIKLWRLVGSNKAEWEKFNPANENYSANDDVKIRLRMWRKPDTKFRKNGEYYIYFRCKNGFRSAVDFFHLEERYEFHKDEALRLLKLKAKYPKSTINRISGLLGKPESEIKEDLFHKKFLSEHDRCFAKLTKDILG